MKICIVGPSDMFLSGVSYYTDLLVSNLKTRIDVCSIFFRKIMPKIFFPGKNHVGMRIFNNNGCNMDYANPISWIKMFRFMRKEKPDVIILEWWSSSVAHMQIMVAIAAKLIKARIIIEFHEVVDPLEYSIFPIKIYASFMGKLLVKLSDGCITHSSADRDAIKKHYNVDSFIIPMGPFNRYRPMDKKDAKKKLGIGDEFVALFFGLIRTYKGLPVLLRAFDSVDGKLIIAGEFWDRDKITQDLISSLSDKIILFDEYIPDDMVSVLFSAADVVVLPYLRASQSGVGQIAIAFGKQIIASDIGGFRELSSKYDGVLLIKPGDITALRNAIIDASHNVKEYVPITNWNETIDNYISFIYSVHVNYVLDRLREIKNEAEKRGIDPIDVMSPIEYITIINDSDN